MNNQDAISNDALEWFGFTRLNAGDCEWEHRALLGVGLQLWYFNGTFHFVLRQFPHQGIGSMTNINELVSGFHFVSNIDLWQLATAPD